ncbi:MAG: hypothetical protein RLZ51_1064 [Pseudomonadota bacterium]|jgi:uncharacterized protein (TIGR02449 family)
MDQDLSELEARISQLLTVVRRLSEHNQTLRAELEQATAMHSQLKARMGEARTRVQAVLDRLPRHDESQLPLGLGPDPLDQNLLASQALAENQAAH